MLTDVRMRAVVIASLLSVSAITHAGFGDWMEKLEGVISPQGEEGAVSPASLSQQDISAGLKEALSVGVQRAIELLGRDGGFLNDPQVKIPMPAGLSKAEGALRAMGQEGLADNFVATMNHAAERAVPETTAIFGDTIRDMSLEDARAILEGPDDSATQYFREQGGARLSDAILPIVKQATDEAGVTSAYKALTQQVGGTLGPLMSMDALDLDRYVTNATLDGLFLKLAAEEKRIREDPVARSTDLLEKVFGSVSP